MTRKDDLLGGIRFVKLTTVYHLPTAEEIQRRLREGGVGAVILNDEQYQARPEKERARAVAGQDGFRIDVPERMEGKAREILSRFEREEERENG